MASIVDCEHEKAVFTGELGRGRDSVCLYIYRCPDCVADFGSPAPPNENDLWPGVIEESKLHIKLPFIDHSIGLGDAISSVTSALGIQPCGGCKQRAEKLNQIIQFDNRGRK